MKRDMALIRLILLNIEGDYHDLTTVCTASEIVYHLNLLLDGGFLTHYFYGNDKPHNIGGFMCEMTYSLTWKGHDFIDASRDETFFKKALEEIKQKAVPVTIGIVLEYLKAKAKEKLGIE